jgi:hypothetical protein
MSNSFEVFRQSKIQSIPSMLGQRLLAIRLWRVPRLAVASWEDFCRRD